MPVNASAAEENVSSTPLPSPLNTRKVSKPMADDQNREQVRYARRTHLEMSPRHARLSRSIKATMYYRNISSASAICSHQVDIECLPPCPCPFLFAGGVNDVPHWLSDGFLKFSKLKLMTETLTCIHSRVNNVIAV